ncbi:MAG TPA: PKD domain-containing protein [Methanosarcina sp.]|nr:PKD domain-containing protein [Methanosarcina sp.]
MNRLGIAILIALIIFTLGSGIGTATTPLPPVANFSTNVSEGFAPLSVQFNDSSENATGWNWDFGDGVNSTQQNPTHTYYAARNYTVNLTATNENDTNSKLATITVLEKPVPVNHWEFSPQEPVCGDTININGSAFPEKKVNISVTFEKAAPVSEGKFEYILENVTISEGLGNLFTVEARGVNNLNVRAKKILWLTKSTQALRDTAIVSQSNVPAGTYRIIIDGDTRIDVSEVNLKVTASQFIQADSNGNFSCSYNTISVPPGNFEVKVGDTTKEITLRPNEESVLPVANFTANKTEGLAPLTINFTDLSENATSVNLDFGDGNYSTERNSVHEFTTPKTYIVSLNATNENGTVSKLSAITVFKEPVFPGYTDPATDPNKDGYYEDITGDGKVDFDDVIAYCYNMEWMEENTPVALFDYNNNNCIDFDDVVILYNMI